MSVKTHIRIWLRRRRRRTYKGLLELERCELRRRVSALEAELAAAYAAQVDGAKATVDTFARMATKHPVHDKAEPSDEKTKAILSARDEELDRRRLVRERYAYLVGETPAEIAARISAGEFSTADLERRLASAEMPIESTEVS